MNFYRHWYGNNENATKILGDVSRLGFYSVKTNEPIDKPLVYRDQNDDFERYDDLYWYKDTLHQAYLYARKETSYNSSDGYYYHGTKYHFYPGSFYNLPVDDTYNAGEYWCMITGFNSSYPHYGILNEVPNVNELFFIPLKGGGFILNTKLPTYLGATYQTMTNPTIPFKTMPIEADEGTAKAIGILGLYSDPLVYYNTLIGIPATSKSIINNYIYIVSSYKGLGGRRGTQQQSYTYNWSIYNPSGDDHNYNLSPNFCFQNEEAMSFDFFKVHNMYNYSHQSQNKQYMNFNPNVCVLSKVPYDNGFIDNLYYMVTCPTSEISNANYQGIFFSFEGRNFINIYGNMVLELPGY